jgi:outer membrane cobalamin receptor
VIAIGDTSRPTFVVDRTQIESKGARTLGDALVGVPGVELFAYGPFGAQTDFGIRGAASQRTLVLVDGQPIADPTTGAVDLTQLSTAGVQRIEIVESAASALYGTSAGGGVINIITSVPRGTYVEGALGSYDDRDLRAAVGNGIVGATFERHVATNAFAYPAFTYGLPGCTTTAGSACNYPAGVRENAYGDLSTGRFSTNVPLADGISIRGRLDATSLNIGVPSRLDGLTPNTTNRLANDAAPFELARTTPNGTLSLDLSGATQRSAYADPSFGEDDVLWGRSQVQDLYYPGYSNPDLLPEKSRDSDATLVADGARGSLSLGWFGRSGSNFIVLDPVTFIPYNAQRAQTAGFTITARSKRVRGLIADANFTDLYRALDLTTGARLPRNPVGQASAGLTRPFGATRMSLGLRFGVVGSDGDDAANVPPPLVGRYDSYTSIDAYVRYKLSRDGILSVRGFNLGNDREAPIFGYPNVGRRIVVELSTR